MGYCGKLNPACSRRLPDGRRLLSRHTELMGYEGDGEGGLVMDGMRIRQIQRGLMRAGAKMCPYFRQSDGGAYEHIGCILAIKYMPQSRNQLRIEIPGVIMRADAEHLGVDMGRGQDRNRHGERQS